MQQYRAGEEGTLIPPRSDRFYKLDDDWYFQVRGGTCFGPYACRREAEEAVKMYFEPQQHATGAVIHPFGNQRAKYGRNQIKR